MPLLAWSWGRGCLLLPHPYECKIFLWVMCFQVDSECAGLSAPATPQTKFSVIKAIDKFVCDVASDYQMLEECKRHTMARHIIQCGWVCVCIYIEPTIYILIITKQSYCECIFVINTYSLMHKQSHLKFLVLTMLILHWKKLICRGGRMKGR